MTAPELAGLRVIAVTPRLWPTWGAGTQRTTALVTGLVRAGATVTALVATSRPFQGERPKSLDGVDLRVASHPWGRLPWQVHHASMIAGARDPLAPAHRRLARAAASVDADLVVACGPPWSAVELAAELAAVRSLPFAADLRDEWASNPFQRYLGPVFHALSEVRETRALRRARLVTAPFAAVLDTLRKQSPAATLKVLGHGCDSRLIMEAVGPPHQLDADEPMRLLFAGARYGMMNESRFLTVASQAKRQLPRVHLQLVGAARPVAVAVPAGMTVELVPPVDHRRLMHFYDQAHALLALGPRERGPGCIPSKIEEYRATGRPILAFAETRGDLAAVVAAMAGGTAVAEDDPEGLCDALHDLRRTCETRTDFRDDRSIRDWEDLGTEWAAAVREHVVDRSARE